MIQPGSLHELPTFSSSQLVDEAFFTVGPQSPALRKCVLRIGKLPLGIVGQGGTKPLLILTWAQKLRVILSQLLPLAASPCSFPHCPTFLGVRTWCPALLRFGNPLLLLSAPCSGSACKILLLNLPRLQIIPCVSPISSFELSCSCNMEKTTLLCQNQLLP